MNLKDLRLTIGWAQEKVAEKARLSRTHYVSVEVGKRRPNAGTAQKLRECLGFSWQDFSLLII